MLITGIDPGAHCGVVILDVPDELLGTKITEVPKMVEQFKLFRRQKVNMFTGTKQERDGKFFSDMIGALGHGRHEFVVLEQPVDGTSAWRGANRTGTSFRLGATYGFARAAVAVAQPTAAVYMYAVKGSSKLAGWMRRRTHESAVQAVDNVLLKMGEDPTAWSDDEKMAYGVLLHHIGAI